MTTAPQIPNHLVKITVAFLDGRRIKGYTLNFSALKNSFDLLPQENSLQQRGERVEFKDVKAIFFVKDFAGNPEYHESKVATKQGYGKSMEITFADGEQVVGITSGYNRQNPGFFLIPADPMSNNARIFIV